MSLTNNGCSVVRKALAQFHKGDWKRLPWDLIGNTTQRLHFILSWEIIVEGQITSIMIVFLRDGFRLGCIAVRANNGIGVWITHDQKKPVPITVSSSSIKVGLHGKGAGWFVAHLFIPKANNLIMRA